MGPVAKGFPGILAFVFELKTGVGGEPFYPPPTPVPIPSEFEKRKGARITRPAGSLKTLNTLRLVIEIHRMYGTITGSMTDLIFFNWFLLRKRKIGSQIYRDSYEIGQNPA